MQLVRAGNITWDVVFVEPGVLQTLVDGAALLDLQPMLQQVPALAGLWRATLPHFRLQAQLHTGLPYVPLGGLSSMLHYRADVLSRLQLDVPATWQELLGAVAAANGTSSGTGGPPLYGFCNIPNMECIADAFHLTAIWASMAQTRGVQQAIFFDLASDMRPQLNSSAMLAALELYRALNLYAPRLPLNASISCNMFDFGAAAEHFAQGRCAFLVGPHTLFKRFAHPNTSAVAQSAAVARLPGSAQVLHPNSSELVNCTQQLCPYADWHTTRTGLNGSSARQQLINRTPFLGISPMGIALSALPAVDSLVLSADILRQVLAPSAVWALVTDPVTPIPPFRYEHFADNSLQQWAAAGYDVGRMREWLALSWADVDDPNLLDMPLIPRLATLRAALHEAALNASVLPLSASLNATLAALQARMEVAVRPTLEVATAVQQSYAAAVGRPGDAWPDIVLVVEAESLDRFCPCPCPCLSATGGCLTQQWRAHCTLQDIDGSTSMWEELDALACVKWHGYESGYEGDSFIIAFHDANAAAAFTLELQHVLLTQPWPAAVLAYEACKEVWVAPKKRVHAAIRSLVVAAQRTEQATDMLLQK